MRTFWTVIGVIAAILIAWVVVDHHRQRRMLADLEEHGVTRRSERTEQTSP